MFVVKRHEFIHHDKKRMHKKAQTLARRSIKGLLLPVFPGLGLVVFACRALPFIGLVSDTLRCPKSDIIWQSENSERKVVMIKNLVVKTRSYRRFDESDRIMRDVLVDLVDTARMAASAANKQPQKYAIVNHPAACERMFSTCAWAAKLTDWEGPQPGERPTGYIVILRDAELSLNDIFSTWDAGIAAQTMMLSAVERGWGGCMICSFRKEECAQILGVKRKELEPLMVIALGRPVEDCRIEDVEADGSIDYWRDEAQVHHVPKRKLNEVLALEL